jgi:hypothetical protein
LRALGLTSSVSDDTVVTADADGFCATVVSKTGKVFSVSSSNNTISEGNDCPAAGRGPDTVVPGGDDPELAAPEVVVPPAPVTAAKVSAPGFEAMCGATETSPMWSIPDRGLQRKLNDVVRPCGPLTLHDAAALTDLTITAYDIGSLSGLEKATNVRVLVLDGQSGSTLPDLATLKALRALEGLTIQNYASADLTGIGEIVGLKELTLVSLGFLDDISPLATLTKLEGLSISSMPVENLSPLRDLHSLKRLTISGSIFLTDVGPLAALSNLVFLDISHTYVKQLGPLTGLTGLQTLDATDSPVSDWRPVAHVPEVIGRPYG